MASVDGVAVLISDVHMAVEDEGLAPARWMAEQHPGVPVILTSGTARVQTWRAWEGTQAYRRARHGLQVVATGKRPPVRAGDFAFITFDEAGLSERARDRCEPLGELVVGGLPGKLFGENGSGGF